MAGALCPRCGAYTIPPSVWHGAVPPRMCFCYNQPPTRRPNYPCRCRGEVFVTTTDTAV